jgi:ATP-binding cassette subfamily F protein 2
MGRKKAPRAVGKAAAINTVGDSKPEEPRPLSPWMGGGVLASLPQARDIKIDKFSVQMGGEELIKDTLLELSSGNRYGLIGTNGTGKSTMLKVIAERQVPIPEQVDIFYLSGEVEATEETAFDSVLSVAAAEVIRLESLAEQLTLLPEAESEDIQDQLGDIYDRLEELDADGAPARVGKILHGLGFSKAMQQKKTKDFSGGWRMRIALARALFISPSLLLLDEPTNHLDLEACVWLEEYLKNYKRTLVLISHSQDFLNGVCTHIMHLKDLRLTYYKGNYDTYVRTRAEKEENQMKMFKKEQAEIAHMKDYIARFGHGSKKLARQGKSMEKRLNHRLEQGLVEAVTADRILNFGFFPCGNLPPPVLTFTDVTFRYNENTPPIYEHLDFGVDLDSRVALVGPNGAGKSTLLKLMCDDLTPTYGFVRAHPKLRIARFHQHLQDLLDVNTSPIEFIRKEFPKNEAGEQTTISEARQMIGRYGITGKNQTNPIKYMSDGMKSRLVFAWLAYQNPHLLLLDEPTNHLDIETIDVLAYAIQAFEGGVVLVSHDFRLIDQVAEIIYECRDGHVIRWEGDIHQYKNKLRAQVLEDL